MTEEDWRLLYLEKELMRDIESLSFAITSCWKTESESVGKGNLSKALDCLTLKVDSLINVRQARRKAMREVCDV